MSRVPEFSRPYRLDAIGGEKRAVHIEADEAERAALAARFGLVSIAMLEADATIRREGVRVWAEGRLKGRAQVSMHFTTLVLSGGYAVQLPGSVNSVPSTNGPVMKGNEGKIEQQSSVGQDARNISTATSAGTGAGALASVGSSNPMGVGYGALAGGVGGVAYTLLTRGKDIELPVGEPIEMVFDRPLQLSAKQAYVPKPTGGVDYVPVPSQSKMLPKPTPQPN